MNSLECWMLRNRPKMNESKREMIVLSSSRNDQPPALSVAAGGESVQATRQLRHLGLMLDIHLTVWCGCHFDDDATKHAKVKKLAMTQVI